MVPLDVENQEDLAVVLGVVMVSSWHYSIHDQTWLTCNNIGKIKGLRRRRSPIQRQHCQIPRRQQYRAMAKRGSFHINIAQDRS